MKFVENDSDDSIFVDAEGTLGLPDTDVSPALFGRYRFSPRHSLGFGHSSLKRSNPLFSRDIDIGDISLIGRTEISDCSQFYYLAYNYTFMEDHRTMIFGVLCPYGLDAEYQLDAYGQISIDGKVVADESITRKSSTFSLFPMIGVEAVFALTSKWSLATKVALIGGSVGDIRDAQVLDTSVTARYMSNERIGLHFGISTSTRIST